MLRQICEDQIVTDTTTQFKRQLPRNLFMQVLSFVLHIGIGIWLVPYLIHHLGRSAYGLISLAAVMTQYVSLISHSISSSVQRFLAISLQRNDTEDANRIFNTAFLSYLALGLIQMPIFGLIIYYAHAIFSIPQELYRDAIVLLTCSAATFLINLVCSVYAVPLYANNRLDISRGIDITRLILRLTGIVVLFAWFGPRLRYVGYVDLILNIVLCGIRVCIGRRLAPALKLGLRCYEWGKVKQLMGMGCWLFVSYVGSLLLFRVDIWVCNRFVSPESAGDYAALLQWSTLIRMGGRLIVVVVAPMVIIYYARSEIENIVRMSILAVRLISTALAIPIGIVCVFSPSLLSLWLGDAYARLAPLMVIILCPLVVHVSAAPLLNINTALNRVEWPGIVTLIAGGINIVLAILFVKYLNWGLYGVALASAIVLTAKNTCFLPIYGAVVLDQPWHTFVKSSLFGVVFLGVMASFAYVVNRFVYPVTWLQLVLVGLVLGSVGSIGAWLGLSKRDRRLIAELVPTRFRDAGFTGAQL